MGVLRTGKTDWASLQFSSASDDIALDPWCMKCRYLSGLNTNARRTYQHQPQAQDRVVTYASAPQGPQSWLPIVNDRWIGYLAQHDIPGSGPSTARRLEPASQSYKPALAQRGREGQRKTVRFAEPLEQPSKPVFGPLDNSRNGFDLGAHRQVSVSHPLGLGNNVARHLLDFCC